MTSPSFYNQNDPALNGIYFDLPENQLGKELQRRKNEQISKNIQLQKLVHQNSQIKALKQKIQQGYLNKQRAKQLAEKQVRRVDQLVGEAQFEAEMITKKERQERQMLEVEAQKQKKRYEGKQIQKKQMNEKAEKEQEAYKQYLRQKQQVQKVMQTLINSELRQMQIKDQKKKKSFQDMQQALTLKETQKLQLQDLVRQEEAKYMTYIKELDKREAVVKKDRQEKEELKDKLIERLKLQEEKRRVEAEQLDSLRRQLYQEEYEAQIRKKEQQETQKRERQRMEMQRAQRDAKQTKRRQKQYEDQMEIQFRRNMLDKFAKDDKLEQLIQQKRRIKQQEHIRQVERLWQLKLYAYRLEKQRELQEHANILENAKWEQEQIERQKQKLLKEHLPNLEGFMPKELAKLSNTLNNQAKTNYGSKFRM